MIAVGQRRLLAWTCLSCHQMQQGDAERRQRHPGQLPYVDRRCKRCRWRNAEQLPGRNN